MQPNHPEPRDRAAAEAFAKLQEAVRNAKGLIDLGKPASEFLNHCVTTDLPSRVLRLCEEVERLKALAREMWESRRGYSPSGERLILQQNPWLEENT